MTLQGGNARLFPMRSKLFVPGSRPDLFSKAMGSAADAVCFDLEDSVLPEHKTAARAHVREFLLSKNVTQKHIVIRVNDFRSPFFAEDLTTVIWPGIAIVTLPKATDSSEIEKLAAVLSMLEKERGIGRPVAILPTIESPRGLRQAYAIGSADERVIGLQLGLLDFLLPLGITGQQKAAAHHVRLQLRFAAGEVALPCFDCAFPDLKDTDGFTADAAMARSLGFSGKSCIHPSQIPIANKMFTPTAEEITIAYRILEKARDAADQGLGAFALGGRMIDQPMIRHAEEIIELHAALCQGSDSHV
jgi:citrate lyase subunit beta / citryl-CoA lyase